MDRERSVEGYEEEGRDLIGRTLRHPGLWLALVYAGLIALMARTYAS